MTTQAITILVGALGGEGGGVLAEWLYDTAVRCGHSAQGSSIPGVAQRTGATTYYIEIWPRPDHELGGRRPLFSLNPVPGAIDLLVSSELLESVRQAGLGYPSAERTHVISSSARALTVQEKMPLADGRLDGAMLLATLRQQARSCDVLDMTALAQASGTVISAVLFGAIAGSGRLPFERAAFEDTIRRSGRGVEASLRGFASAFDAMAASRARPTPQAPPIAPVPQAPPIAPVTQAAPIAPVPALDLPRGAGARAPAGPKAAAPALPEPLRARFPAALHEVVAFGRARLIDYQDHAYAERYVERLSVLLDAERAADPDGRGGWSATHEAARWLALWMAFDDIVRVAALKLRASRIERVRREVGARDDELVEIFDHFKPGVPELAGLLPAALARRLTDWDRRRVAAGRDPWALPLQLGSHTVAGALALRIAAACTGMRRRGSRFAAEQALIERWLAAVQRALRDDLALGFELAQCGRLIKGYGSTNERGKDHLLHIVDHLAAGAAPAPERAAAVRAARDAALADDAGKALDQALVAHGAPPRPLREQPIRWVRRPTGARPAAD